MPNLKTTNVLSVPGEIDAISLSLPDHLEYDDWANIFAGLKNVSRSVMFWIGDALLYGEGHYSEKFAQVVDSLEYSPETIRNAMWVARNVPKERREVTLSYTHHAEVAKFDEADQVYWLRKAVDEEWSSAELRRHIKGALEGPAIEKPETKPTPKDPLGKYAKLLRDAETHDCIRCGGPDSVAAHYSGLMSHALGNGMGKKSHDLATAYLCTPCHTHFDSYEDGNDVERAFEFMLMIMKTNIQRLDDGVLVVA